MSNIKSIFEKLGLFEVDDDNFDEIKSDAFLPAEKDSANDDVDPLNMSTNNIPTEDSSVNEVFAQSNDEDNEKLDDFLQVKEDDSSNLVDDLDVSTNNASTDALSIDELFNQSNDQDNEKLDDFPQAKEDDSNNLVDDLDVSTDNTSTDALSTDELFTQPNDKDNYNIDSSINESLTEDIVTSNEITDLPLEPSLIDADIEKDINSDEMILTLINDMEQDNIEQTVIEQDNIEQTVIEQDDITQDNMHQLLDDNKLTSDEIIESDIIIDDLKHKDQDTHLDSAKEIMMLEEKQEHNDDSFTLESSDLLSSFINENSDESYISQSSYDGVNAKENDTVETVDEMLAELSALNHSLENSNNTDEPTTLTSHNLQNNENFKEVEEKLERVIESHDRHKLMSIDEIYKNSSLNMNLQSTIFMVEAYAKALPENLPLDVKRESVINIMKASNINVVDMLSDAYKRIDTLNKVLENVVDTTQQLKEKNAQSIKDLEKRIVNLKRSTEEREAFQEKQNTTIEYEIQRIINVVDVIKEK